MRFEVSELAQYLTAITNRDSDHEIMYEKGILHRDISFGNILICDIDDDEDEMKDAGMLIDLDHAKYSAERRPMPPYTHQSGNDEESLLRMFRQKHSSTWEPASDVLSKTLEIFEDTIDATTYLREVFAMLPGCLRNNNDTSTVLTANKLYWPDKVDFGFLSLCVLTNITVKDQTGNTRF